MISSLYYSILYQSVILQKYFNLSSGPKCLLSFLFIFPKLCFWKRNPIQIPPEIFYNSLLGKILCKTILYINYVSIILYLSFFFFSSANAKKWEVELTTLKNNNARLTSALQESTANVEEWKRQLNSYKEENSRLKMSLIELEAGRGISV